MPDNLCFLCTPGCNWGEKGGGVVARGAATPGGRIIDSKISTLNAKKRLNFLYSKYFELSESNQWKFNKYF